MIMPILLVHCLSDWYSRKSRTGYVRRTLSTLSVLFSVCAIIGFFLVANSVFLLLPGSSISEGISVINIYLMYFYLIVYAGYIGCIAHQYIEPSVTEDDGSSDLIRDRQLKTVSII